MADLNWYRNFVAVYRAGSVSGAARSRNLTQPAISQQLSALESSLGEALFVRNPRGMQPTEAGKSLYAQVVESLDRLERVSRGSRQVMPTRPLRLGVTSDFFALAVLPVIAQANLPLHVQFISGKDTPWLAQLEAGTLDAVIGVHRTTARSLEHRVLRQKRFKLICSSALRPPHRDLNAWIEDQPWVTYGADLTLERRFWHTHLGGRFDADLRLIVPDLRAVMQAVELGWGLGILPDFMCSEALEAGRLRELLPNIEIAPNERWIMSYREFDADRPEILQLANLLTIRS